MSKANVTGRIDGILKERGMSRRQLAIEAGIPPSSFQAAMARGKNMTVDMLQAVSGTLNVPISYFFSDDPTLDATLFTRSDKEMLGIFSFLTTPSDKLGQWSKYMEVLNNLLMAISSEESADCIVSHATQCKALIDLMQELDPEGPYKLRQNYIRWTQESEKLITLYQKLNDKGRKNAIARLTDLTKIPEYQQGAN